jgi:hypothetical protein
MVCNMYNVCVCGGGGERERERERQRNIRKFSFGKATHCGRSERGCENNIKMDRIDMV